MEHKIRKNWSETGKPLSMNDLLKKKPQKEKILWSNKIKLGFITHCNTHGYVLLDKTCWLTHWLSSEMWWTMIFLQFSISSGAGSEGKTQPLGLITLRWQGKVFYYYNKGVVYTCYLLHHPEVEGSSPPYFLLSSPSLYTIKILSPRFYEKFVQRFHSAKTILISLSMLTRLDSSLVKHANMSAIVLLTFKRVNETAF
jgi:hypothetical protein